MKKILAALALLFVATTASALDFGVGLNRDFAGDNRNAYALTLGQKFGKFGLQGGYENFSRGNDQSRWSLLGSYDVASLGKYGTFAVKGGGAYLNNQIGSDGYAMLAGLGYTIPITKQWAGTVDYRYQWGQDRVKAFDGGTLGAGLKYSF